MQSTVKFSCVISTTDAQANLGMEIWIDDQQIYNNNSVTDTVTFEHNFPDVDGDHVLKFLLKNKTADHTKISETGEILQDARLIVKNIAFDEIELGYMITELATYTHDFNGTGIPTQQKFFSELGCNGTVELKFSTPLYMWLLENM